MINCFPLVFRLALALPGLALLVAASRTPAQTGGVPANRGKVSTLAGTAGSEGSADGLGAAARFNYPAGVAVDRAGTVYVAETGNHTIRKITAAGKVSTLAGKAGVTGNTNGKGVVARFIYPMGVAVARAGTVYVADQFNNTIRKITAGREVGILAGSKESVLGSVNGVDTVARFHAPYAVAVDAVGNVYVADFANSTIRKITAGGRVSTLAGKAGSEGSTDGKGTVARFKNPMGVAVDAKGTVYVADMSNSIIRKITATGEVSTLAGVARVTGSTNGKGTVAHFKYPGGVAVDAAGTVYVADTGNNAIRKITVGGVVSTLAGTPGSEGSADGPLQLSYWFGRGRSRHGIRR